jgi:hypothetical protein
MIRGLLVSGLGFDPTVSIPNEWLRQRGDTHFFACVNAHSAEVAHRDAKFMGAL